MTRALTPTRTPTERLAPQQAAARRAGLRARLTVAAGRQLWAQAALVWLLLALVVVPTLGHMHQVIHVPALQAHGLLPSATLAADAGASNGDRTNGFATAGTPTAPAADAAAGDGHATHAHPHAQGLIHLLLAHHAPVDCLLLDQLALGNALHSAPAALAISVPGLAPLVHPAATAAARHVALFQARGPPALG